MITYWKEEAAKKGRETEAAIERCEALAAEIGATQATLEQTLADLNIKVEANKTLQQQLAELLDHVERSKVEVAELHGQLDNCKEMLERPLERLNVNVASKPLLAEQLAPVLRDHMRLREEVVTCESLLAKHWVKANNAGRGRPSLKEQLGGLIKDHVAVKAADARVATGLGEVLESMQAQPASAEAGIELRYSELIRAHDSMQQLMHVALFPATAAKSADNIAERPKPFGELVSLLIGRLYAARYGLEQMEKKTQATADTMTALRTRLERIEGTTAAQEKEFKEAAANERSKLVRSALASLHALRMHVAATLLDTRDDVPRERFDDFARDRYKNRWGAAGESEQGLRVEGASHQQAHAKVPDKAPRPPDKAISLAQSISPRVRQPPGTRTRPVVHVGRARAEEASNEPDGQRARPLVSSISPEPAGAVLPPLPSGAAPRTVLATTSDATATAGDNGELTIARSIARKSGVRAAPVPTPVAPLPVPVLDAANTGGAQSARAAVWPPLAPPPPAVSYSAR